ncbi:MAG: AMP-dependent synthetase and ligase [Ilumatobacteraceae bacterium]|nr:AMP-dependent synthetase and ligase [Ilumatobacteraceae bacterium]
MTPATIPAALRDAAEQFGDGEAVVDGDARITFRELVEQSNEVARALIASGVEPGDRVAMWAPNSARWIVASFGVYAAGAVLVPFNTRYRGEEAGHILRTSGARLLLTVTDFLDVSYPEMLRGVDGLDALGETVVMSGASAPGCTDWDEFVARGASVDPSVVDARIAAIGPDDMSDIIFTSGTTGAPKGAMLGHGASIRTYLSWSELVDLRAKDRYLVVYPFFHTAGLKSGILACVLRGATVHPLAVFDVPTVLALVAAERITMLPGPPTVFQTIIDHPDLASYDLSSVRSSVTGAAVVPVEVIRQMREVLHIRTVVTGYGMTETTGTISMCRYDDPPEVIARTVGRPIPGVEVRIVDADLRDVAQGVAGELVVRGFNVMLGYFDDPAATAEAFVDGWLRTGDVGFVDDDGNIHITDRMKDMFIVGGFNAYPAEIEALMLQHPDIAQVAVVGMPDPRMGEQGVAFVVPRAGHEPDPTEILRWVWERLAKYKLSRVELIEALPLNPSGKVMKFVLRDQVAKAGS